MISFACKKIELEELIRCSFNLNKREFAILMYLLKKNKKYTVMGLAKELSLERSTIQKAVKKLVEKGLAMRFQQNLDRGGYNFLYKAKNKGEIKERMKETVRQWYSAVENAIQRI